MHAEMSQHSDGSQNLPLNRNELDRGHNLALEEGDAQVVIEYFVQIQKENPGFFYAFDSNEAQCLRSVFWVDGRNRKGYVNFNDVVCFDTSYTKSNERMPISLFIGVNHHFQPMLLGCALLADETQPTFVWLMKAWLRAMGGKAPKVIISDQDSNLKSAIEEVFPHSNHRFALWHILEKVPENLAHVIKQHENFMRKFTKCIFKSLTVEQFDLRWWKMVARFELRENEWIHSIYVDRRRWAPTFMRDIFLAGFSPPRRSESVNSFLDKYMHGKVGLKEFMRQYWAILQNMYEEEDMADSETWHKQPRIITPLHWEKLTSTIYTHSMFKKVQAEILGVLNCTLKVEKKCGGNTSFKVHDLGKEESFMVMWSKERSEVFCTCLMFEYKGFLCRHCLTVLQTYGFLRDVSSRYILERWTKDAKNGAVVVDRTGRFQHDVHRLGLVWGVCFPAFHVTQNLFFHTCKGSQTTCCDNFDDNLYEISIGESTESIGDNFHLFNNHQTERIVTDEYNMPGQAHLKMVEE